MVDHFLRWRTSTFCYFDTAWLTALLFTALLTMAVGVIGCLFMVYTVLRWSPAGIDMVVLFPTHVIGAAVELIVYLASGILLWVGILKLIDPKFDWDEFKVGLCVENVEIMLSHPWGVIIGYFLAIYYFLIMIIEGESVAKAITWAQLGRENVTSDEASAVQRSFYYSTMTIHFVLLTGISTYLSILSLSFIEKMLDEEEEDNLETSKV